MTDQATIDDQLPEPVGFDRLYGFELVSIAETEAHARVKITDDHKQPGGLVHGGVYASIAESLASWATWVAVRDQGKVALGLSNQTSFLRPASSGFLHAAGRRRHAGNTTWIWDVDICDAADRLCAMVRMTVAIRSMEDTLPRS